MAADGVHCPKCGEFFDASDQVEWDFMDGEEHEITCVKCGKEYTVIVERPIEYYIQEEDEKCQTK